MKRPCYHSAVMSDNTFFQNRLYLALVVSIAFLVAACGGGTTNPAQCTASLKGGSQKAAPTTTSPSCATHCYGEARWRSSAGLNVQTSTQKLVDITCNKNCGSDFLDNEIWISDSNDNWIEAGYGTFGTYNDLFYADNRNNPGNLANSGYYEHPLQAVTVGNSAVFSIHNNSNETFNINISATGCSTSVSGLPVDKTTKQGTNPLIPNQIDLGLEVVFNQPTDFTTHDAYFDSTYFNGNTHANDSNLVLHNSHVTAAEWVSSPVNGFHTNCCVP